MSIEQRELAFRAKVNGMIDFPHSMRKEFIEYWSEPNKSGTKMRWELEKTWDLHRRLLRWQRSSKESTTVQKVPKVEIKSDIPEIAELDAILTKYRLHPTEVPFTGLAKFYPYMKAERLLKDFTKGDVQEIVKMFNSDQVKCRAYCVEQTFKTYTDKGWTFALTMETRMRLQKPASNVR